MTRRLNTTLILAASLCVLTGAPAMAQTPKPASQGKPNPSMPPPIPVPPVRPAAPQGAMPIPVMRIAPEGDWLAHLATLAQLGSAKDQWQIAEAYLDGRALKKNPELGRAWLKKAADQGFPIALTQLGSIYLRGDGVPRDDAAGAGYMRQAADFGDDYGQYQMGQLTAEGRGVPEDLVAAYMWLSLASHSDFAQLNPGTVEKVLAGVAARMTPAQIKDGKARAAAWTPAEPTDGQKVNAASALLDENQEAAALALLKPLAEGGNRQAQFLVGMLCVVGETVPTSSTEATKWFLKAAEQGHAGAQFFLGQLTITDLSGPSKAVAWWRKSADLQFSLAQSAMGDVYTDGRGVPADPDEALAWYRKAAAQGEGRALRAVGQAYAAGAGVPMDRAEAYKWLSLAVMYEHDDIRRRMAQNDKDAIARQLTPEQIAALDAWAKDWQPVFQPL